MTFRLTMLAPLVLSTPFLLAQQGNQPQPGMPPQNPPMQGQDRMHRGDRPDAERHTNERELRNDERMDLDELGLPEGEFWLNPEMVTQIGMTPDQVHRMADTHLQGTLKLIQLDANLQMEEAKLEPMLAAMPMDGNATLAQIEHIADAKAAIEKADARLAFALRAVLTPDQLTKLRADEPHGRWGQGGMRRPGGMDRERQDPGNRPTTPQM